MYKSYYLILFVVIICIFIYMRRRDKLFMPDITNCTRYYDQSYNMYSCFPWFYDDELQTCVASSDHCGSKSLNGCKNVAGLIGNEIDCSAYFMCAGNTIIPLFCSEGTCFDRTTNTCEFNTQNCRCPFQHLTTE